MGDLEGRLPAAQVLGAAHLVTASTERCQASRPSVHRPASIRARRPSSRPAEGQVRFAIPELRSQSCEQCDGPGHRLREGRARDGDPKQVSWILNHPRPGPHRIPLRGLDPATRYRVSVWPPGADSMVSRNGVERGGDDLMNTGILLVATRPETAARGDFQARLFVLEAGEQPAPD